MDEVNVQSVLVEHTHEGKVYANSGCLIDNRYVLITSNVLIHLINQRKQSAKLLSSLSPGLLNPHRLFDVPPKIKVVIRNEDSDRHQYKEGVVVALYVSDAIRKSAVRYLYDWAIDVDSRDMQLKQALSLFFIVEIDSASIPEVQHVVESFQKLFKYSRKADFCVGDQVCVESTPFGNRHFLVSHSRGVVSNILGENGCFVLTDVPTAPGSEGSPVFTKFSNDEVPVGIVISSLSWWKGEWIGLTLAASFQALFADLYVDGQHTILPEVRTRQTPITESLYRNVVQVTSGTFWGSAVLLDKGQGIFITNAHVVEDLQPVLHWQNIEIQSKVVFKTDGNRVFDIAILLANIDDLRKTDMNSATISPKLPNIGDKVFALGYPLFPRPTKPPPTLTSGHISQVSKTMLKTSCSVLPGASGGGIFNKDGAFVGLIVCNARMEENSTTYPRVNMAVPSAAIYDPLVKFLRTKDTRALQELKRDDVTILRQWNFLKAKI